MTQNIQQLPSIYNVKAKDWNSFFTQIFSLLDSAEESNTFRILEKIKNAIWAEQYGNNKHDFPAQQRLEKTLVLLKGKVSVIQHIQYLLQNPPLEDYDFNDFLYQWLLENKPLHVKEEDWQHLVIEAEILLKLFSDKDLMPYLEHKNVRIRSFAARKLGEIYDSYCDLNQEVICFLDSPYQKPSIDFPEIVQIILEKEIEAPGIAGAFLGAIYYSLEEIYQKYPEINFKDWILEILAKRKQPEPHLPVNGIDFYAHEILAKDPEYIQKLIDLKLENIAIMAATQVYHPDLKNILIQLTQHHTLKIKKLACWHLAYHYQTLEASCIHFVEKIVNKNAEIFLNYEEDNAPYAAIIYLKEALNDSKAWQWIDIIVPKALQGEKTLPLLAKPFQSTEKGSVVNNTVNWNIGQGIVVTFEGDIEKRLWHRLQVIWYGKQNTWYPKQYLQELDP